jgi:hypothetical protein
MDLQIRKLTLIEWLARLQDEATIHKIENLQKKARIVAYEESLKPMTSKELIERAKRSNDDIAAGRIISTEDLEKESANW